MRMLARCFHLNSLQVLSGGYGRRIYNGKDRQTDPNDLCCRVIRLVAFLVRWLVYWFGNQIFSLEKHHGLGPSVCEVFLVETGVALYNHMIL